MDPSVQVDQLAPQRDHPTFSNTTLGERKRKNSIAALRQGRHFPVTSHGPLGRLTSLSFMRLSFVPFHRAHALRRFSRFTDTLPQMASLVISWLCLLDTTEQQFRNSNKPGIKPLSLTITLKGNYFQVNFYKWFVVNISLHWHLFGRNKETEKDHS